MAISLSIISDHTRSSWSTVTWINQKNLLQWYIYMRVVLIKKLSLPCIWPSSHRPVATVHQLVVLFPLLVRARARPRRLWAANSVPCPAFYAILAPMCRSLFVHMIHGSERFYTTHRKSALFKLILEIIMNFRRNIHQYDLQPTVRCST